MKTNWKCFLSWLMVACMLIGTIPMDVYATEADVVSSEDAVDEESASEGSEEGTYLAKIGENGYTSLAAAIAAANDMTGSEVVTIEIYGKTEYTNETESLIGSYTNIDFVGKTTDAEISITRDGSNGYISGENGTKKVSFTDLILSKPAGGYANDAGFMNQYFTVYRVAEVSYTNCTFPDGACAQGGKATYTNCTFANQTSGEYSLWVYANVDCQVTGGSFTGVRGVKMYAEGGAAATAGDLTLTGVTFTESVTQKPAIVLTYGESVTLSGNTYPAKGVFELDKDGAPNGTSVTADITDIACTSDDYADCGVLVDGKIYTTITAAVEAGAVTAESTVTLMYNTKETVELPEGATLNTNNYTAENITVPSVVTVAQVVVGEGESATTTNYTSLQEAINAAVLAGAGNTATVTILDDIDLTGTTWNPVSWNSYSNTGSENVIVEGNNKTITGLGDMLFAGTWTGKKLEIRNLTIDKANVLHDKDDSTGTTAVGAVVGNVSCNESVVLTNVHLKNSYVEGGHWTGGFIGYAAGYSKQDDGPVFTTVTITGCSVTGSTITGKGSVGAVIGHATGDAWTMFDVESATITGNTITSTGSSTNKAGIVMGTIGAAGQETSGKTGGVEVSVTEAGNTATSNGTTITTVYGRQGSSTGVLTVTGGTYANAPIEEGVAYAGVVEGFVLQENVDGSYGVVEDTSVNGLSGSGTEEDPYKINNLEELKWFRDDVNGGNRYAGKYIKLTAGIDLNNEEWAPIGTKDNAFQGHFDGDNHTISNLSITGYNSVVGLFGRTNNNGSIKNLTLDNAQVSGRLEVGALVGTPSTFAYSNIMLTGHVEVNGMSYVGGVGGKNAYGNWTDITVNVDETSYVKATSTENGNSYRTYVGGVIGFNGEGGHTFKNITSNIDVIGDVCDIGGIFGIAHYGNNFENITCTGDVTNNNNTADKATDVLETGLIAGVWHNQAGKEVKFTNINATGTITATYVPEVSFVNGGLIGNAYNANNETADTSGSLIVDGKEVWIKVAKIGDTGYATLAEAVAAANSGDTITMLSDVTLSEAVTLPAGITFNGNGKTITGSVVAGGDLTFEGYTKVTTFNAGYNKPTITIGEGATLETTTGRMVIGHGATFNITGSITDAKTADTSSITPSLIAPGASFTGAGVNFNVTNAYVKFTAYCSSKNSNANGTFNLNVTNSIWEQTGSLVFSEPTNGMDPTFNFTVKDSVLNSTSHLVFAVTKGEIVFDNSNVNVNNYKQLENRSNLTIKNGSVVYASVQISSNAKNPGTTTVDNATYVTTGTFGGADVGIGTLVLKNNASFTTDTLAKVNVTVDGTSLLTATKGADTTTTSVTVDGSALEVGAEAKVIDFSGSASIKNIVTVNGKGVVATYGDDGDVTITKQAVPVASVTDAEGNVTNYTDLQTALKALTAGATLTLLDDVTITEAWDCRYNGAKIIVPVTIDGDGHTLKLTGSVEDKNWNTVFRFEADATVKNLTIDASEATDIQRGISAKYSITVDNCTFIGNGSSAKRAVIFGEGAGGSITDVTATINKSTFTGWSYGVSDNQSGKDAKSVSITDSTFTDASVLVSAAETVTFTGNTVTGGYVNITSYTAADTVTVTATGNTLVGTDDEITVNPNNITADAAFITPVAQIGSKYYETLSKAMTAAKSGEVVKLLADVDLAGSEWEPVSFKGNFDGQGHTIKNLTINKPGVSNVGFVTSLNGTIANVTFENPTVTGGDCTGVVAGRAGGGAALAENIKVTGTIKVETTHSGYARAGVIVGGWAYGNYRDITVDGGDKSVSYIKHTGGGDGRYVGGIVGHADDVASYVNCTVKNITISGGWLCGGIAGPGPSDGIASGCAVENVDVNADYSGGMFGWYYGDGIIEDSSVSNVTFTGGSTNNGAIGGYSNNENAKVENVTISNVKNIDNTPLLSDVAEVNGVGYATVKEALEAVEDGETIIIRNITGSEVGTELDFTKSGTFTITGTAPNYKMPIITVKNETGATVLNIVDATLAMAELDARQNATINVINSTIEGANGNDIVKAYYNGVINVSGTSTIDTMQVTVMGRLNLSDSAKITATWQTNVYGNGIITIEEGAVLDTAALNVTGQAYSGRDNTDADRVGQPATILVDGGTLKTLDEDHAYYYEADYAVLGTDTTNGLIQVINGGTAILNQSESATINSGSKIEVTDGTFAAKNLVTNKNFYINGDSVVKVENLNGRAIVNDDTILTDSYIKSTGNGTTRVMGDLTLNGGFSAAFFMTDGSAYNGTITIEDNTVLKASYGVELDGNVTVNGGTIELSGGNASGSIWGFVVQSGTAELNCDIVVNGAVGETAEATPIHFTNATATVNGNITQSKSGGEPIYIKNSTVTLTEDASITTDCAVHVNTAGTLKSSGNIFGTITKAADDAVIEISGGTYKQNVNEWCVEGYVALPNLKEQYVVGEEPTATINNLGAMTISAGEYEIFGGGDNSNKMPLNFVMQFVADQTEEDMETSPFADWYGDFVITITGLKKGSFIAKDCYLAGYYGDFGWIQVPIDSMTIEEGVRYPVMLGVGYGQKYDYICTGVKDFRCAMYLTEEILNANPNLEVKLELSLVDNSQGKDAAVDAIMEGETIYEVASLTYNVDDFRGLVAASVTDSEGNVEKYETLEGALGAAQVGDTVKLMKDCTGSIVMVPAGVVLDLNGKMLTATYFVSFGDIVDGNVGGVGGVIVGQTSVVISSDYSQLPLYDSTLGGYRFFAYEVDIIGVYQDPDSSSNVQQFWFSMLFENKSGLELLQNSESTGLSIKTKLEWTGSNKEVYIPINNSLIDQWAKAELDNYDKWAGEYGGLYLSVGGMNNLEKGNEVSVTPVIVLEDTRAADKRFDALTYVVE